MAWFTANEHARVINFLGTEIERLRRARADFALIAAITPKLVFDVPSCRYSRAGRVGRQPDTQNHDAMHLALHKIE